MKIGFGQCGEGSVFSVERLGPLKDHRIWEMRGCGNANQKVEVVGHDAVGEDLDPTELRQRKQQIDQPLFGQIIEQKLPPDGP